MKGGLVINYTYLFLNAHHLAGNPINLLLLLEGFQGRMVLSLNVKLKFMIRLLDFEFSSGQLSDDWIDGARQEQVLPAWTRRAGR